VPGPQFPLYLLGREMEAIVPIAFLPEHHALAIAIMSYNGKVEFGLLGDYDAMPDLDDLGRHLEDALAELLAAARERSAAAAQSNGGERKAGRQRAAAKRADDGTPAPTSEAQE
jgi:diacylglycerol O-acyltransferase